MLEKLHSSFLLTRQTALWFSRLLYTRLIMTSPSSYTTAIRK